MSELNSALQAPAEKGLPYGAASADVLAGRELNVARGDLPLPVLTLSRKAVNHNISTMAAWCAERNVLLAPHGKTTLAPELFRRQLDAGAWGLTVFGARQAELAIAAGAKRIIVAGEVVDACELRQLSELASAVEIYVFVDSEEGLRRLAAVGQIEPRLSAFIEFGIPKGRTGVRTRSEFLSLLHHARQADGLKSVGIAAYEGLIPSPRRAFAPPHERVPIGTDDVRGFLAGFVQTIAAARSQGLVDDSTIVTAGGSGAFDVVVEELRGVAGPLILRSGCYITHDHGVYQFQSPLEVRNATDDPPKAFLEPALRLWARVISTPENGCAVLGFGRRDTSNDTGSPVPLEVVTDDGVRRPLTTWTVRQMWDQHALVRTNGTDEPLAIGDAVVVGISHPCTTFDKWRRVLEVDDNDTVIGVIDTYF